VGLICPWRRRRRRRRDGAASGWPPDLADPTMRLRAPQQ
jgi:hypothetical protein